MDSALLKQTFASASWCTQLIRSELALYSLELPFDLEAKLELSAVKLGEETVYRPYAVLAALLSRAKNDNHLNEGEGSKFRDADKTIKEWRDQQTEMDQSLGLVVAQQTVRRTGSRSIPVRPPSF